MVNVVGPESATVAAPPERVFCVKLPSGELSRHEVTFFALQKTVVLDPSFTCVGIAQMSTCGLGPVYTGAVVVACMIGVEENEEDAVVVCMMPGERVGASTPT